MKKITQLAIILICAFGLNTCQQCLGMKEVTKKVVITILQHVPTKKAIKTIKPSPKLPPAISPPVGCKYADTDEIYLREQEESARREIKRWELSWAQKRLCE